MVEGATGQNLLARIVIVNIHGNCIYDKYVIPMEKVSDYRFKITGITEEHLKPGNGIYLCMKI